MSYPLFYTLLSIRVITPPIIFYYMHPFWGMILNEVVVDGIISPQHVYQTFGLVPEEFDNMRKPHYDLPLDAWGFLNSLQPIMCKNHKYNDVFVGYESFLLGLFLWRTIGIILLYIIKDVRILALFPNFFIGAYTAISGCSLYKVANKKTVNIVIILAMLIAYVRELYLIMRNIQRKTQY